jgi:hypothetical protein
MNAHVIEEDGWWLLSKLFGSDCTDLLINGDAYQNREHVPLDSLRFLQGWFYSFLSFLTD